MNEVNNAGRIGFYPRGNYSNSATYNFLDFVYYGGASYVAKQETTGNTPAENNEFWQILARCDNNAVVIGDEAVEFVEATTRANISSGEVLKTMLGKIRKWYTDFKTVAFTGSYNDLINKPTIPSVGNGTLTIQKNGSNVKTFTANQSSNVTANIAVPTSAADVGAVATSKVLTTKEQINANTDTTNIAGATAVKAMVSEINGNLAWNKSQTVTGVTAIDISGIDGTEILIMCRVNESSANRMCATMCIPFVAMQQTTTNYFLGNYGNSTAGGLKADYHVTRNSINCYRSYTIGSSIKDVTNAVETTIYYR